MPQEWILTRAKAGYCDDCCFSRNRIKHEENLEAVSVNILNVLFIFPFQFVLTEMYYDGFHRSFCDDDDDLDIIQESDSIFAFETPETFKLENIRTKRGKACLLFCTFSHKICRRKSKTSLYLSQEVFWQTWIITTWSMGQKSAGRRLSCRGPWLL